MLMWAFLSEPHCVNTWVQLCKYEPNVFIGFDASVNGGSDWAIVLTYCGYNTSYVCAFVSRCCRQGVCTHWICSVASQNTVSLCVLCLGVDWKLISLLLRDFDLCCILFLRIMWPLFTTILHWRKSTCLTLPSLFPFQILTLYSDLLLNVCVTRTSTIVTLCSPL